jgi:hypothetical protein
LGTEIALVTVIAMYRDENGKLLIKDYKLC